MFATSEANLIAIFIDSMLKNSLYSYRNARQPEQDSYFSGLNGGFQVNNPALWVGLFTSKKIVDIPSYERCVPP